LRQRSLFFSEVFLGLAHFFIMSGCRAHETYAEKMDLPVSPLELPSAEDHQNWVPMPNESPAPRRTGAETISRIQQRVQKIRNSSQAGDSPRKR
jgi:hypothetical protein